MTMSIDEVPNIHLVGKQHEKKNRSDKLKESQVEKKHNKGFGVREQVLLTHFSD